jgi:hypothetical protein
MQRPPLKVDRTCSRFFMVRLPAFMLGCCIHGFDVQVSKSSSQRLELCKDPKLPQSFKM